jgi:hypothetical protein
MTPRPGHSYRRISLIPQWEVRPKGSRMNEDGSFDIYFSPEAPVGFENNWLQTIPGKSFIAALRMYGPLEAWIDKTWRPSEVELVN